MDGVSLPVPLQLLRINAGISFPFADRLLEYLTGNAITGEDEIVDDIIRVQTVMKLNGVDVGLEGVWSDAMRAEVYSYMTSRRNSTSYGDCTDMLGYVDKDVEQKYMGQTNKDKKKGTYTTIAGIDIYPDIYLADKEG